MNKPTSFQYIAIGLIIGILIGGFVGLYFMVYHLDIMKTGIQQRNGIIEWMNRDNNKNYQYEKGDEYITPILITGVSYPNGSWKTPPFCFGGMCLYNFTGVVRK